MLKMTIDEHIAFSKFHQGIDFMWDERLLLPFLDVVRSMDEELRNRFFAELKTKAYFTDDELLEMCKRYDYLGERRKDVKEVFNESKRIKRETT